jgi:hypothetical protein
MIVFVHQPEYMPWLGFFDKLARCDTYVIYDDAQYQHGGFHNRNKIRTAKGWEWLTVPIVHGHPQTIKDVRIAGTEWKKKHLNAIMENYRSSSYFKDYFPLVKEALDFDNKLLIELDLHLIKNIADVLSIKVKMVRSSDFSSCGKEKSEKLVSMCKFMGADTYLSGSGGKSYLNEDLFSHANIKVMWHNYEHPIYKQTSKDFEPNMSVIDLLLNTGKEAKQIILQGGSLAENIPFETARIPNIIGALKQSSI